VNNTNLELFQHEIKKIDSRIYVFQKSELPEEQPLFDQKINKKATLTTANKTRPKSNPGVTNVFKKTESW